MLLCLPDSVPLQSLQPCVGYEADITLQKVVMIS